MIYSHASRIPILSYSNYDDRIWPQAMQPNRGSSLIGLWTRPTAIRAMKTIASKHR